jgi:hypothetical protein
MYRPPAPFASRRAKLAALRRRSIGAAGSRAAESAVRHLGIHVDDALAIADQVDVWSTSSAPRQTGADDGEQKRGMASFDAVG